jgi:hypothetical protein
VTRDAKLTYEINVEWSVQRLGHFVADRHAAARQCEHEHVPPIGIVPELQREKTAGFTTIAEPWRHGHRTPPSMGAPGGSRRQEER